MTKENRALRDRLREIELFATNSLHLQPEDDGKCEVHLTLALAKVAEMSADFLGMSCVEAYDIVWDTDATTANDFGLPNSMMLSVAQCNIGGLGAEIAEIISERSGWKVKSCKYRLI